MNFPTIRLAWTIGAMCLLVWGFMHAFMACTWPGHPIFGMFYALYAVILGILALAAYMEGQTYR